ncbi:MAG: hypothetical protein ACRD1T_20260, partial [Acidimicrobiia bacterium]
MNRRVGSLLVLVGLVLSTALLGIATNVATSQFPEGWRRYQGLAWLLLVLFLILAMAFAVGQHVLDRPAARAADGAWPAGRSPYPGLAAFTEEDAAAFFGRDREVHEVLARLHPVQPHNAHRFLAVVGPSGSGKSSLLCAGLL